jgi:hypothetical protein
MRDLTPLAQAEARDRDLKDRLDEDTEGQP